MESQGSQDLPIASMVPLAYNLVKLYFFELRLFHAGCHLELSFSKTGLDIPKNAIKQKNVGL